MSRRAAVAACLLAALLASPGAQAAEPAIELEPMRPNLEDLPSLQRGMTLYVNYCIGCHSLKFQRYERTAADLGIPPQVAESNLIFTGQAIGELMKTAMPSERARNWFGAPPPDLTLVDRVRGTAWVYNMLKNFYVDEEGTRPFGVNNRVFPNIGMPHVLIGLQGVPRLVAKGNKPVDVLDSDILEEEGAYEQIERRQPSPRMQHTGRAGSKITVITAREPNRSFIEVEPGTGSMTAAEYDQAAYDIANFLHYVGDPGRAKRKEIGVWVLAFLAGLFVLATFLNREYWKDVH